MKRLLLLLILPVVLSACATAPKYSQPVVLEKLSQAGISPETYARMQGGRVLSYDDILGLVKKDIPDAVIASYLKSTHAPYKFTNAQLLRLSDAGAGSTLMNYLGKSVGYFEATQRDQTGFPSWENHPYFNDPYFWGPAPFDYGYPGEWYMPGMGGLWM